MGEEIIFMFWTRNKSPGCDVNLCIKLSENLHLIMEKYGGGKAKENMEHIPKKVYDKGS